MTALPFDQFEDDRPQLGLIALQSDETIEDDLRQLLPTDVSLLVSRVPSAEDVSSASLRAMKEHLTNAASLMPRGHAFDVVGYGCTSGTAEIGPQTIAKLVRAGCDTHNVTEPVSALLTAARALKATRMAILSPYVEEVSANLRDVLARNEIATPAFASFEEPSEHVVARIAPDSILKGARGLAKGAKIDAIFLSCTNLRTLAVIDALEDATGVPVLSSNLVLAWHMLQTVGLNSSEHAPGRLNRLSA